MSASPPRSAKALRVAAIAVGAALALPVPAQQDSMHGMQMSPPVPSSSAPAPASSSTQSIHGMDMPMAHHATEAKPSAKNAKDANGAGEQESLQPSSPRRRGSSDFDAETSRPRDARGRGRGEQKMGVPAMQHASSSPSHGVHALPPQPSRPVQLQHLDFGSMVGVRREPGGLAEGAHDTQTHSMEGMDMSSMQGGAAPPDARSPDYSDGYRYTDMPGMAMSDHAMQGMLLIDQLEYTHDIHGNNGAFLDGQFWYGRDFDKLWVKFEGEQARGKLEDLRFEALWYHATSAYWGTQLGVREDLGEGPNRTWAAFGMQGLAPYWFETAATLYVGPNGRTAARFRSEYELLFTQRLVLQPEFEMNLYGRDDPQRGIGSGLSDAELGLRLRYELKREFAPYIGLVWRQRFGRTADFYRAQGEPVGDLQFVAGIHFWF